MASSINASTSAGVVTTADTSGVLNIQTAGTTAIAIDASQAVSFTNQPVYSGGTANGVAYLNGSKVLTTGSALVFDGSNLGLGGTTNSYGSQTTMTLSGTNVSRIDFRSNSTFTGTILSYQAVTEGLRLQTETGYPITFYPAGAEAMRLTSTSLYTASTINVGIGTTSPATKLHISTDGTYDPLRLQSTQSGYERSWTIGPNVGVAGLFVFRDVTAGQNRVAIDSSGNLGIGTTSPLARLNASGGTTITSLTDWNSKANTVFTLANPALRLGIGYDANDTPLIQGFTSTNAARDIAMQTYGGNLVVGGTTNTSAAGICCNTTNGISIERSGNGYRQMYMASSVMYFFNGTNQASLSSAGAWTNASDARLKNSIINIKHGLSAVMNTQPRSYKMNDLEGDYIGFVAQELQTVIPEVVSGDPEKQLGVDYGSLVAVAFKAIQEQQALITQLQADVAALKGA